MKQMLVFVQCKYVSGVDDNGSGVAALLETAKIICRQNKEGKTRQNTIIFASFDLEEYGM